RAQRLVRVARDEGRRRAARERVGDERLAGADGDEEVALLDLAGVDLHPGDGVRAPLESPERLEQRELERDHPTTRRRSARTTSPGSASARASSIAARRSSSIVYAAGCPPATSAAIASGASLRGLSEVRIARSASSRATLPIAGRLARSRSPPAPNTTVNRPRPSVRAARSTFARESGVCA